MVQRSGEALTMTNGEVRSGSGQLMEQVVARGNVRAALARVRENRGRPGVDGMTVEELPQYLMEHWEEVREQLLGVIRRLVREEGIAVVLIEHAIEFVMTVSDRIVVLNDGKVIADGTPAEVPRNREVLEAYLGH